MDVWKTIEPDLLTLLEFWKTNILPPLQSIFGSAVNILGKIIKKIIDDFKWFYNFIRPIFKPLGKLFSGLYNTVAKIFGNLDKGTDKGGHLEIFTNAIAGLVSPISVLKTIIETTTSVLNVFKTKITETWQSIKDSFADIWKSVKIGFYTFVTAIIEALRKVKVFGNIEGWRFESTKAGLYHKQKNGNMINVTKDTIDDIDDGIITPNNQVIKTNPKDYIIAMKHPQKLASASGAGGGTYTININANVRNDNDIRQIKNELERLIKSFNSKR